MPTKVTIEELKGKGGILCPNGTFWTWKEINERKEISRKNHWGGMSMREFLSMTDDTNHKSEIEEECIGCDACVPECPNKAISEGDPIYIIDCDLCTGKNYCRDVCPVECIVPGCDKAESYASN